MAPKSLFPGIASVADRQPKTDRLILGRFLERAAKDKRLNEAKLRDAHAVLLRWADLEKTGRLIKLNETQMQGDFLAQVFGEALGYDGPLEGSETWHREQHYVLAGQAPDAILGHFRADEPHVPRAVVELKGPKVHLDRDRSNGRTAIDQCWDYLVNSPPECRWGIVSNFVSFRLYERDSTKRVYEHFTLQSLRDFEVFRQFHALFHRQGLVEPSPLYKAPVAAALLEESRNRQREVGDKLYEAYSANRIGLIEYLHFKRKHPLELSIEMAQRLLDRIMFIAFCEDRLLLPAKTIPKAYSVAGFHAVTNPRWQNFKNLFRFIDEGSTVHEIPKYNGGLFARHPVDDLELPDEPWTNFFHSISHYDFADEVNLDVLGHLFERSITEIEKLKESGLFGGDADRTRKYASMPQSAKRKQMGIYYTPAELTSRIVQYTVDEVIVERFAEVAVKHGVTPDDAARGIVPDGVEYWRECLGILRQLKIVDPACGSGAFLFQAYSVLEQRYLEVIGSLERARVPGIAELHDQIPSFILQDNLYGVDLSPEAVEITQLALWIRSATPGQTLSSLAGHIVFGNSLVHDASVESRGFDWRERFPEVFDRAEPGFDCVIGNPPWERIKLQEREFFSLPAPEIATATSAAIRRKLVAKLEKENPSLFDRYRIALDASDSLLSYCRRSNEYPLTGKGDINTYAVFAELAYRLVAPRGRVGLLVPSGIATDKSTMEFFAAVAESGRLIRLYDFENRKVFFPEVHASFKFCILNFSGSLRRFEQADYVFFAHGAEDIEDPSRHIPLTGAEIRLVNPNTRTCPVFRSNRDARITKGIYRRIPVLVDHGRKGPTKNAWGIRFRTMFHQTNDAELFHEADALAKRGFRLTGNRWVKGKEVYEPIYEAKMFRSYDHRFGSVFEKTSNWINQGQTSESTLAQHQNPEFLVQPRWWVDRGEVFRGAEMATRASLLAFRDVTRSTDTRTMIATMLPVSGVINTAPLLLPSGVSTRRELCLLACLNSLVLDYVAKQKTGHIHMNFFILEQLPIPSPDSFDARCPWHRRTSLESWISERVLMLICTSVDMLPLSDGCHFSNGSFQPEYGGRLHKWNDAERAELMAELDAAFFQIYGIERDDIRHILSTFKGIHEPNAILPGRASIAQRVEQLHEKYSSM